MRSRTRTGRRGGFRARSWAAIGLAGVLAAGMAAPGANALVGVPGPELEYEWERGTAGNVLDGDTLYVAINASNSGYTGTQRVRTIGINAPEVASNGTPAQCGAVQAERALRTLAPAGTLLQLRALAGTSYDADRGRIVRSIYAQDEEGNWFDTARQLVSDGTVLWFPHRATLKDNPEWAHNLEYRVLADDARAGGRGLWSADYCGPSPAADLAVSVSWDQSVTGYESIFVFNRSAGATSLAGWTLRDAALNLYRFPSYAVVPGGGSIEVRLANGTDDPASGLYYAGNEDWFDNLPADNPHFAGDAAYLMDNAGSNRTGNLRAWFPYPCNPDECDDPLAGRLRVATPTAADWNTGQDIPSAPRQVDLSAGSDRDLTVRWQAPTYVGDAAGVTRYRVVLTPTGGGTPVTRDIDPPATSTTFTGLAAGSAHSVTVAARNAQGWSSPSASTGPVTARTVPGAPRGLVGHPLGGAIAARWEPPSSDGGSPISSYRVTATPVGGGTTATCTTADPSQSCVLTGVSNGTDYVLRAVATNGAGSSSASASVTVDPAPPAPVDPLAAPSEVRATPLSGAAVVSWAPPAPSSLTPAAGFLATALASGVPVSSCQVLGGPNSCVIPGLANGSTYGIVVRALTATGSGPDSDPAVLVTPTADARVGAATGVPTPAPPAWAPRETLRITNTSGAPVDLTGYALWDKDPRNTTVAPTDTPDVVFPRGTTIAPGATLRVRSGPPTFLDPGSATLVYTGSSHRFAQSGDRIELANLNKAPVDCVAWGGVSCRGQRPQSTSTQPVGITARTSADSMTVAWGAPISRGGTAITGYTATAFTAPDGGTPVGSCTTDGSGRACTIGGLALGGSYYAEVVARNAVGTSAPSAPRVLGAPKTIPGAPPSVTVGAIPGGLNVGWAPAAPNGAVVTRYTAAAYMTATGGAPVATCTTSNGSMSGCVLTGLTGGITYHVEVTATNRAGTGPANSPRVAGAPGAGSAVSTYSKGRVTVRWDAPAGAAAGVTGYVARLYTKKSGGKKVGECSAAANATSCRTKKMKKRSKYYIDLTVMTGVGAFTAKPRIVTGPAKKASAPAVVTAGAASRRVAITWAPPTFNGYSYLKGYGARLYSKAKGGKVRASCSTGPTVTTCTTKSLKKGKYYAAARVKNAKGWSGWTKKRVKVIVR